MADNDNNSNDVRVQIEPEASGAPVVPYVNRVILRRQDDSFFIEGYMLDNADMIRRIEQVRENAQPGETVTVQVPYLFRVAVSPSAMANLVETIGPFWESSLREFDQRQKNEGSDE